MKKLINEESTTLEVVQKKQWKESMIEEYQSIMKNDVWEIMQDPRKNNW
jgi:hypothetical protein